MSIPRLKAMMFFQAGAKMLCPCELVVASC
jgi:hypothetical protein